MSHFLRRVVPVCAIAAIAVAAFAAAGASGAGGCQLGVKMTFIPGSMGAGNVSYKLTVTNRGSSACRVTNKPALHLLGKKGQNLPTNVRWGGRSGAVLLRAGKSAHTNLRFSPDIPGPGEPSKGPCEPKAHSVKLIASTAVTGPVSPPTSVCEHGTMRGRALR